MPSTRKVVVNLAVALALGGLSACSQNSSMGSTSSMSVGTDGPANPLMIPQRLDGNAAAGRDVFRFETFGNERFWTDAVRLPAGMMAARVTPMQALELGVQIDMDALDQRTRDALAAQLRQDPSGRTSALLNDPAVTVAAINANAVIGMPIKDSNGDGVLDIARGDKAGVSCALCHTVTDGAAFSIPGAGSIGHRLDGRANHGLNLGKILATAANSRAMYPGLQLSLRANKGKSLGRAPSGLTESSSEAEVDASLSNPQYYPVGMFDDSFDGNGDPMHNTPLFRQDLAAPYGSEGTIAKLENFSNLVYTSLFDLTELTTPGGRAFLHKLGGAAGDEIADNYVKVLAATGVTGYPFVQARMHPNPGSEEAPIGLRVDDVKLLNMNAYLASLQAPKGEKGDGRMIADGRRVFRSSGCTSCHNLDQSKPVSAAMIPMSRIFPGDNPVILAQRDPPLNPIMDTPGNTFDDKMAVVNASIRGDIRGIALPLLLDLARKPVFLHDNSVPSLDMLFDPSRGPTAPHPFYVSDSRQRANVVTFLKSLDTGSR